MYKMHRSKGLKENAHLRDSNLMFDEKSHTYTLNGVGELISVTTLIQKFKKEFNSDETIEKFYTKWQQNTSSKYYGKTKEEIRGGWEDIREDAARKGTELHRAIEDYYNDLKFSLETKEFGFFLDFDKEIQQRLTPYRSEWRIYDENSLIAGTIDMLYEKKNTNEYVMFDWKRSAKVVNTFGEPIKNSYNNFFNPIDHLPDNRYFQYALQ